MEVVYRKTKLKILDASHTQHALPGWMGCAIDYDAVMLCCIAATTQLERIVFECFWVKSRALGMVSTLSWQSQVIHQFIWVYLDIGVHCRSFGHAPPTKNNKGMLASSNWVDIPRFLALILPVLPIGAAGPSIRTWRIIMLQSMSRKRGSKSLLVSTKFVNLCVFSMAGVGKSEVWWSTVAELKWVGNWLWWNEPGAEENWGGSMILRRFGLELVAFLFPMPLEAFWHLNLVGCFACK